MIFQCTAIYQDDRTGETLYLPIRLLLDKVESWYGAIMEASGQDVTIVTMASGNETELLLNIDRFDGLMLDYYRKNERNGFFAN